MGDHHVLNLGAGVQSTALFFLACGADTRLRFDVAVLADTQDEPSAVYRHLDHLKTLGGPPIWVRTAGSLGDNLIHGTNSTGQRFVSVPAFTRSAEGKVGMVRRQCTAEFKINVVNKAIRYELLGLKPRQRIPKGTTVFQYFGISTDEAGRAARGKKRFEGVRHMVPVYPLIDLGWSRRDCLDYLRDRLPHPAPKSSCVFCPYRTNQSWLDLKRNDPEGWARAVEIDRALRDEASIVTRGFRQQMFLHRTCEPLPLVQFERVPPNTLDPMATGECAGMCGV